MAVSDRDRRVLHDALAQAHGGGVADTMMELLPPVGWGDVARQSDMVAIRGEIAELRGEMLEKLGGLQAEFGGLRAEFGGLRAEFGGLRAEFGEFKGVMQRQLAGIVVADLFAVLAFVFAAVR